MSAKTQIQQLSIIWFSLIFTPLLFFVVTNLVKIELNAKELATIAPYLAVLITCVNVFLARFLYNAQRQKAVSIPLLEEKLNAYRIAKILQGALLEGAAIICVLFYLLTKTTWLVGIILATLFLMVLLRPSLEGFKTDFKVKENL